MLCGLSIFFADGLLRSRVLAELAFRNVCNGLPHKSFPNGLPHKSFPNGLPHKSFPGNGLPHNPLINSGAIMTTGVVLVDLVRSRVLAEQARKGHEEDEAGGASVGGGPQIEMEVEELETTNIPPSGPPSGGSKQDPPARRDIGAPKKSTRPHVTVVDRVSVVDRDETAEVPKIMKEFIRHLAEKDGMDVPKLVQASGLSEDIIRRVLAEGVGGS